ncbi:MAG: 3-phosphoglycerate dehydrogenase [Bacteroidales bacterium]|nr:3-phosphoglycerate dehydrogenase [Bacteroidales bacterium]
MTKVLLATDKPFAPVAVAGIQEICDKAGLELVKLEKYKSPEEFKAAVKGITAIIVRSDIVDKAIIDASDALRIIVRAGAGYDNIDLAAASAKKIVVMNTPGQNANAVAELAVGMMIYLNRNGFNGTSGIELRGKKLGIHGYGHIGKILAQIGKGLGMKVYAHDPFVDKVLIENDGVVCEADVKDLYRKCQYVSVNIPANSQTKNSINFDLLNTMPEGATLVNTARKEIIDEAGLLNIFEKRPDFRYVSDVAPDNTEQLKKMFDGRFFFTPKKMGAQTAEANTNAGLAAARQIVGFIKDGDTTFKVN